MNDQDVRRIVEQLLTTNDPALLDEWSNGLGGQVAQSHGRISAAQLRTQCRDFLDTLASAVSASPDLNVESPPFESLRDLLGDVSRSRATQGFSPSDTANFVLSLKKPLAARLAAATPDLQTQLAASWQLNDLLDQFALHTTEIFQKSREDILLRQQEEITELSTPVVKLWDGILALPLIGTLDSARTQVVMETLLQAIVDHGATVAIIDITGVPTVDTLVAQHLLKTVAAARLMGADCLVSGIRPQIAQTMIHLGLELNVVSKATLADAFALALERTDRTVVRRRRAIAAAG